MKNLFLFTLVAFNFLSISLAYADGQLGDVVYSYLEESKFIALHGSGWTQLSSEKDIRSSDLCHYASVCKLIDNRGNFIRIHGKKSDGIAVQQYCTTACPRYNAFKGTTFKSGKHTHDLLCNTTANAVHKKGGLAANIGMDYYSTNKYYPMVSENGEHDHEFTISEGGDDETRPHNIALFAYIKINNDEGGKLEREEKEKQNKIYQMWQESFNKMQKILEKIK